MMQNRTHTCGELRLSDAGKQVKISGWMENVRVVSANLAFVVVRDFYGTTQVVAETEDMVNTFKAITKESTISVEGTVRERDSKNGKIATLTYKQALDAATKGILEFLITDDGYLVMRSDDKLGLAQGSVSSTIDKVAKDIAEGMVTSSINMDGHLVFQSWDALGLIFEMDDEGHLIVRYNEA